MITRRNDRETQRLVCWIFQCLQRQKSRQEQNIQNCTENLMGFPFRKKPYECGIYAPIYHQVKVTGQFSLAMYTPIISKVLRSWFTV